MVSMIVVLRGHIWSAIIVMFVCRFEPMQADAEAMWKLGLALNLS